VDPEYEWIVSLIVHQDPVLLEKQIENSRELKSQVEAVHALWASTKPAHSTLLERTLMEEKYFYRVRLLAAEALAAQCMGPAVREMNMNALMRIIESLCYNGAILQPNNFSDFGKYFLQKVCVWCICVVGFYDICFRKYRGIYRVFGMIKSKHRLN